MRKYWKILFIVPILILFYLVNIYCEFDIDEMEKDIELRYSQIVLDDRGDIIGAYLNKEEQWQIKGVGEIPKRLKLAVLNYEDRNFYSHNGVDYLAILRAVKTNILDGRRVGASTITMQGVKLYKRRKRTYLNKLEEIVESYKLEKKLSKDEILQLYLNNAPYGGNIVGYETASQLYFKKKAINLTWAEGALLAVLPNSPGLIHIEKNRESLLTKRNNLLKKMYERGVIEKKQYLLSIREPLPKKREYFNFLAPHLTRRLKTEYSGEKIIKSTINTEIQQKLEKIAKNYGDYLNNRGIKNTAFIVIENATGEVKGYVGSQDFNDFEKNGQIDGVMAKRSVGSVLKPFLYALSIDEGLIVPKSKILDVPLYFSNFTPQNANKKYQGLVRAKEALQKSLNIPFVNLLDEYGGEKFFYFLKNVLNFPENDYSTYGLSLILGTKEMSVEEIGKLYYGLSQYGNFGKLKYIAGEKISSRELISKGASYLTIEALEGVQRYGIDNLFLGRDNIAWKTGTSYGQRDAWAGGISPRWTVVVWCGNFTGEGNRNISGVATAGQLLFNIFKLLPKDEEEFLEPKEKFKIVDVDKESGYRLKYDVPSEKVKYPVDAKPLKVSPYYKKIVVNSDGEEIDSRDTEFFKGEERVVISYPIELLDYLARENINIAEETAKSDLKIIYPLNNLKIFLPRDFDERKKVIVKLANPKDKKLYWYHNGKYIYSGRGRERAFDFSQGKHKITVVTEDGKVAEVQFYIVKRGDK